MWIRAAAAALCLALVTPAYAQDPVGPYRFGMTIDEVRATAPDAAWRAEGKGSVVTLVGGPMQEIRGERFMIMLHFTDEALAHVSAGRFQPVDDWAGCLDAFRLVVAEAESRVGPLSGGAFAHEEGRLLRESPWPGGTVVREYGPDEHAPLMINAAHANWQGRVTTKAEMRELSGQLVCLTEMDFDREPLRAFWDVAERDALTAAAPGAAEFEAATVLRARPQWAESADDESFQENYPPRAWYAEVEGRAVLDCLVRDDRRLRCRIESEEPAGRDFGWAALRVVRDYRIADEIGGESTAGKRVRVRLAFRFGD